VRCRGKAKMSATSHTFSWPHSAWARFCQNARTEVRQRLPVIVPLGPAHRHRFLQIATACFLRSGAERTVPFL